MSLAEDIRLGERASQLLGDEVLNLAFANIERDQLDKWRNSPVRDNEAREAIWNMMRQMDALKAELSRMASVATFEKKRTDDENDRRAKELQIKRDIARELDIPVEAIQD